MNDPQNIIDVKKQTEEKAKEALLLIDKISNDISQNCIYGQIFSLVCATAVVLGKDFVAAYTSFLNNSVNEKVLTEALKKQYPEEILKQFDITKMVGFYRTMVNGPLLAVEDILKNNEKEG